jgi:glyoxylase-like metal-dependent hydrolase (beta-lactamase superfamily II)
VHITSYTGGLLETNGYLIESEQGAVAIDAPTGMWAWCQEKKVKPTGLLLTHQHFDHVDDAAKMQAAGIPIHAASPFKRELLIEEMVLKWGLPLSVQPFEVDHVFSTKESPLKLSGIEFELRAVPGHSPDSFVFHVALFQKVFAGDTLFAGGGMGRCDLPLGDGKLLLRSIREQLLTLPDETDVFPGHGPPTTIGREIVNNPHLR